MKGLIYKDFYLGRKFFLFSFLFFFITALLFVLIRLSMICGNLAHGILTKDEMDNIKTFSLYVPCLVLFIPFCTDGGVIFSDYTSKWHRFCYSTSLSDTSIVSSKYIAVLIRLTFSFIISILYNLLMCAFTGDAFRPEIIAYLYMIFTAAAAFSSLYTALSFFLKNKNSVSMTMFAIITVILIPFTFQLMNKAKEKLQNEAIPTDNETDVYVILAVGEMLENVKNTIITFSPLIIIGFAAVGFFASLTALKRREN